MGKLFIIKDGYGQYYTNRHCSRPKPMIPDGAIVEDIEAKEHVTHRDGEWAVRYLWSGIVPILTTIPEQYLKEITTPQLVTPSLDSDQ